MATRKCCDTPNGSAPHADGCHQGSPKVQMREAVRQMTPGQRAEFLDDIAGEMPDGAYWAMAHDLGIEPDDLVE